MNSNESSPTLQSVPKLAPPGAGIPFIQRMALQYIVAPFVAGRTPWSLSADRFKKLTQKILEEIDGLTDRQSTQRILVPPQKGLEDSSRFWSIAMTLEHIVIVGKEMKKVVTHLSHNEDPPGVADTAKVKPEGEISDIESVKRFKDFVEKDFLEITDLIQKYNTRKKFLHPWFGKITAHQWYWVLVVHHRLHLQQIREIKKRLPLF